MRIAVAVRPAAAADESGVRPSVTDGWSIGIDANGAPERPTMLARETYAAGSACTWEGFVTVERYVRYCESADEGGRRHASLVVETAAGLDVNHVSLTFEAYPGFDAPLVDTTRGWVFIWSPARHELVRADVGTGLSRSVGVEPGPGADTSVPTGRRPFRRLGTVAWSALGSRTGASVDAIAGSADGSLLFAAGGSVVDSSGPIPSSTGIWVFDAATLELVDHWAPQAAYRSIGLADDGAHLLALGAEGLDPAGRSASWGTTLTVHDIPTGAVSAMFGDVGRGSTVHLLAGVR
jgi:hypothetical protein